MYMHVAANNRLTHIPCKADEVDRSCCGCTCVCVLIVMCRAVERRNLIGIINLVVKGLIEVSMRQGKTLNDDHPQLQQCLEIGRAHV